MKNYFNFSKKEKIGVLTLSCVILFLVVLLNVGNATYIPDPFDVDYSKLEFLSLDSDSEVDGMDEFSSVQEKKYTLFDFDPNKIEMEDWMKLGFSEKQSKSILKYRNSYGPFRNKEHLKELYVVSDEKYIELEPYIFLEKQKEYKLKKAEQPVSQNQTTITLNKLGSIELNQATKEELMEIKGIGEYYANRIIAYRSKIGGFIDAEQIYEMSIKEEVKDLLSEAVSINAASVKKWNINNATKAELRQVPYSNWVTVASILKFRESNKIENLDFLTSEQISEEDKVKFEMYIIYY